MITTTIGEQYMYYGSAWDGIYILKLDPATGLAASSGDKGKRIANRGFTAAKYNGNIEGAEVIYNPDLKKYFLFISYDWLQTKYNVRVGRADNPTGPFYDYNGHDLNTNEDHGPMILAPYQFANQSGWQGTGHCAVFDNGSGQYFMAHQARPGVNSFFMDLHVRKISWTTDGWPIVSPERYANVAQTTITAADVTGTYEKITLNYHVVPGYGTEQVSPDFQTAIDFKLDAGGTINGNASDKWTFTAPWITLKYGNGDIYKLKAERERDWENKVASTIILPVWIIKAPLYGVKRSSKRYEGDTPIDRALTYKIDPSPVKKEGKQLKEITLVNCCNPSVATNKTICAKMFINCTYEGDLMARSGVAYAVGWEANSQYDERSTGSNCWINTGFWMGLIPIKYLATPKRFIMGDK